MRGIVMRCTALHDVALYQAVLCSAPFRSAGLCWLQRAQVYCTDLRMMPEATS